MSVKPSNSHRRRAVRHAGGKPGFMLKLFIAGMSSRSVAAIQSIRKICEQNLDGQYQLEIVDLYHQPARAQKDQIIAAPTLIKEKPLPLRRIVGSMEDEARVMSGLNVKKK
jgi:circadian clock protein KaiB